jgi:hypothetical protein
MYWNHHWILRKLGMLQQGAGQSFDRFHSVLNDMIFQIDQKVAIVKKDSFLNLWPNRMFHKEFCETLFERF